MVVTSVITEETTDVHIVSEKVVFNLPHAEKTTGRVVPMDHGPNSKVDFGASVYGIDLNNFTDADFELISDALHKHKMLVFKEQPKMLAPQQQYRLTASFDPNETTGGFAHGADPYLTSHKGLKIYGIPKRPAIPVQPQVHILGRGPLPKEHYGFPPDFQVQGIDHEEFHLPPHIPAEEREAGASRFYQWHFDGSLYSIPPPRVGCLLAVRTPKGPDVTVRWDDGTGTEMKIAPGSTAMVAGSRALELLDGETREIVMNSRIEYAPHAFVWMSTAHSARLGHLLETEGLEKPLDQLPPWDKDKVCIYPMVWTNPKTGEKSLQVHGQGAFKLYLKDSPDGEERVVDDLKEVREFMNKLMRPVLEPENIYAHRHEEQDVILWYNRALWHSIRLRKLSDQIYKGVGFELIRGLEPAKYTPKQSLIVYAGVSSHVYSQRGFVDVTAKGVVAHIVNVQAGGKGPDTTAPAFTQIPLSFHTDNCEVMAFFYMELAESGGDTLLSSLWQTYNELAAHRPEVLRTLARPWVFDSFKSYDFQPPRHVRPLQRLDSDKVPILIRFSRYGILGWQRQRNPDLPAPTEDQIEAADAIQFIAMKNAFKLSPKKGDLLFANDMALVHAREGFDDGGDVSKRHLIKMHFRDPDQGWGLPESVENEWKTVYRSSELGGSRQEIWDIFHQPGLEEMSSVNG